MHVSFLLAPGYADWCWPFPFGSIVMQNRLRNLGLAALTTLFAFGLAVATGEEKEAKDAKEASKNPLVGTWSW